MAQNRLILKNQLEKSTAIGSIIVTNAANEQKYVAPGTTGQVLTANGAGVEPTWQALPDSSFIISDGTNSETVNAGNTITFQQGDGVTVTVGATDLVTIAAKLSADPNNGVVIGSDGGLYYNTATIITGGSWIDTTNTIRFTLVNGSFLDIPVQDLVGTWLADFTITGNTGTDVVNNHENITFTGTGGIRSTVTNNQVSYEYRIQRDLFSNLTTGNTVTVSQTPLTVVGVYRNGLYQVGGAGNDYTFASNVLTFALPFGPSGGGAGVDQIEVVYSY